jgi:hypothetical protein
VTTVGIVYVSGFSGLQDARDAERLDNMERAFDVLGDNVEDIDRDGAPSRATELKLADGSLTLAPETNVTVWVDGSKEADESIRPLVYASGDTRIAFENGAVLRSQREHAWMTREPTVSYDDRDGGAMVFTVVDTNRRGSSGVAGDATVLVRTIRHQGANAVDVESGTGATNVTVTIETTDARATAWARFLEDEFDDSPSTVSVDPGRSRVTLTVSDADRWVVRTVHMDVAFA